MSNTAEHTNGVQTDQLSELVNRFLTLEKIDENIYRGITPESQLKRVFGGQVFAQAMRAAQDTVPNDRCVHSQHAYFLRPGDPDIPIIYTVDPIRDGGSFTTRRVIGSQRGRAIFNTSLSFQLPEPGFEHQSQMPKCPPPEELMNDAERWEKMKASLPAELVWRAFQFRPIEIRRVNPPDFINPEPRPAEGLIWVRAKGELNDDIAMHQAVLAYTSDYFLLPTSLRPHAVGMMNPKLQAASLDHCVWFHDQFRADDWLLYHTDSPRASQSRGLTRGSFYTRDGRLVASSIQEGLIRMR